MCLTDFDLSCGQETELCASGHTHVLQRYLIRCIAVVFFEIHVTVTPLCSFD